MINESFSDNVLEFTSKWVNTNSTKYTWSCCLGRILVMTLANNILIIVLSNRLVFRKQNSTGKKSLAITTAISLTWDKTCCVTLSLHTFSQIPFQFTSTAIIENNYKCVFSSGSLKKHKIANSCIFGCNNKKIFTKSWKELIYI